MNEKEFIHVEVDSNNKLSAKMCCTPKILVVMIASMLIKISEDRDDVSIRDMLNGIIWLTDPEVKVGKKLIEQMIDEAPRRIDE
ncbi:MAG: hypothetical protein SOU32_00520 [Lachnospiraceae bacterium]|nr:hypothetical protein [Lachnospiraceae bacterium]